MAKKTKKPAPKEKSKMSKPKPAKTAKPTAAEQAAERKKKQKETIARKVGKLTEMSKVTAEQAHALVETYDESEAKADGLKEQIGGLKGQTAEHKAEIRKTAREVKGHGQTEKDRADMGKKLAGLELDVQRWEVKLAALTEERTGHRETMKATMHELRKLIRDKAQGGLLFEKSDGAEEARSTTPSSTSSSSTSASTPPPAETRPSKPDGASKPTPAAEPAPRPSSKSKPDLKPTTVPVPDKLASISLAEIHRQNGIDPRAVEILANNGITTLGGWRELSSAVFVDTTGKVKFPKGLIGTWIEKLDHAVKYWQQDHVAAPAAA